jgi:DNA-binding ferritin-like protein
MASIITPFLTISNQIKVFHWQTSSFSEHKALDQIYEELEDSIDEFIETYQGTFGRIFSQTNFVIELKNYKSTSSEFGFSSNISETADGWIEYLKSFDSDAQISGHTDLLNIRDEMLGSLNQLKYLITLM